MRNKLLFHLGNILILGSFVGFTFIFYPLIAAYFTPPPVIEEVQAEEGTFITIPKIKAQSQVILDVDPWNEAVYDAALEKGVAHADNTSLPGEEGTSFLFAHSSGLPWEMTRMNTIFLKLGELEKGDTIIINHDGEELRYAVREMKEVDPSEVQYLLETERTQLILQTCTPIGTSLRRLLIFADPI